MTEEEEMRHFAGVVERLVNEALASAGGRSVIGPYKAFFVHPEDGWHGYKTYTANGVKPENMANPFDLQSPRDVAKGLRDSICADISPGCLLVWRRKPEITTDGIGFRGSARLAFVSDVEGIKDFPND